MADLTLWWAFWHRHKDLIVQVVVWILVFTAGWQFGMYMSPYNSAHTIVFEDRSCSACESSGGSPQILESLKIEAKALRETTVVSPDVAGTQAQARGDFVASVNSDLFHHISCASVKRIKEENKIWFTSYDEAVADGYSPSACAREIIK